jgi:phage terminase Nu1 subunit (DNA packaging protein)
MKCVNTDKKGGHMYVTGDDIAKKYGVTKGTVNAWRKKLGMPCIRMSKGRRGGLVLFNVEEVNRWIQKFKQGVHV